jgi:ribonuclease HI
MSYIQRVHLYTDGGCKGNPGPGAIGIVVCTHDNKLLHEYSDCIGNCTNNQAEYKALIKGLDLCAKYTRREVVCFSDSELVIKQMNAEYRLRDDTLRELWHEVNKNKGPFFNVTFQHVPKTNQRIQQADNLLKQAQEGKCIDKSYERKVCEATVLPTK